MLREIGRETGAGKGKIVQRDRSGAERKIGRETGAGKGKIGREIFSEGAGEKKDRCSVYVDATRLLVRE